MPLDPPLPPKLENKVVAVLDKVAAPDWRIAHKMWSVQLSMLWGIMSGLWVALPAFQSWLPPVHYAVVCIIFALVLLPLSRLVNQPGLPLI